MSDEEVRALEHAVLAGDETERPALERLYERTGAGLALSDRIREHVGSGSDKGCPDCRGTGKRMVMGLDGPRDWQCYECDGTGLRGPHRYLKGTLHWDYLFLNGWVAVSERLTCKARLDANVPDKWLPFEKSSWKRAWVAVARKDRLILASAPHDDWIAASWLARWRSLASKDERGMADPTPREEAALLRRGGSVFSGPLVSWWSGAKPPKPQEPGEEPAPKLQLTAEDLAAIQRRSV